MMWGRVIVDGWLPLIEADTGPAGLVTLLGGLRIYHAQSSRPVQVPSVEWLTIYDVEQELFNPIGVQVDYWAKGIKLAAQIEKRIRTLTHRDVARELGGLRLWTMYKDSRTHDYPADPGVVHRSLDFEFKPLRARFHSPVP